MRVKGWAAVGGIAALAVTVGVATAGAAAKPKTLTPKQLQAQAAATVKSFTGPMTSLYLPPLKKKPAAGKYIITLAGNSPSSLTIHQGAIAAAAGLGWKAETIQYANGSAPGLQQAFETALSKSPDGIYLNSLSETAYPQQLAEAKAKGIPVVVSNNVDPVGNGIIANVSGAPSVIKQGKLVADWIFSQSGTKSNVGIINTPVFPSLQVWQNALIAEMKRLCKTCPVTAVAAQPTDIGTNIPSIAVATMQKNPKINYLAFGFGDLTTGVRAALDTAGIKGVKITGIAPSLPNIQRMIAGQESAWITAPLSVLGWKAMDAFARYFNKENVAVATTATPPLRVMTPNNVGVDATLPDVVDFELKFLQLWKERK
jgi:ABC-type sugar transport system substrate-binding protein